jgi:hypothetical protein
MLATQAFAVELFRYRGAARDGGTLEYLFESDRQDVPASCKPNNSEINKTKLALHNFRYR